MALAIKVRIKSAVFRSGLQPTRIKGGIGRGVVLRLDRRNHMQIEFGLYEAELTPFYRGLITRSAVVYDIGAAFGDTSLPFARLAADGLVVAFEPSAPMRRLLKQNLALNPLLLPRIKVLDQFVGSTLDSRTVSIDHLVDSGVLPAPAFIKIDVDGPESDVLAGGSGTLRRTLPPLIVEVHGLDRERECTRMLAGFGYRVQVVPNAWWRAILSERRPIGHNRWLLATRA